MSAPTAPTPCAPRSDAPTGPRSARLRGLRDLLGPLASIALTVSALVVVVSTHQLPANRTWTVRTDGAAVGGTAATVAPGRGFYGSRWNPCKPITYQLPAQSGYRGSVADIRHAVHVIATATGMTFVEVGSETADPDLSFSWQSPTTEPDLAGVVAAMTWTTTLTHDGVVEIASASVHLDRTTRVRRGFATSGSPDWGQVYLHELGHAVGLAHVTRRTAMMNPSVSSHNHVLAAGDRSRLRQVGTSAGCVPSSVR
jgi:hypothetical protein